MTPSNDGIGDLDDKLREIVDYCAESYYPETVKSIIAQHFTQALISVKNEMEKEAKHLIFSDGIRREAVPLSECQRVIERWGS